MKKILSVLLFLIFFLSIGYAQSSYDPYPLEMVEWDSLGSPPGSVSFFAEKDGRLWVANGNLFYSDDQGHSWQQHPQFSFNDIDKVFASDHGITVTRRKLAGCVYINQCSQFLIYLSTDGGETFMESETAPFYESYSTYTSSNSSGVIKKSETEFIFYIFVENNFNSGIIFYNSLDGGLTWKALEIVEYSSFYSSDITFFQDANALSSVYSLSDFVWRLNIHTDDYLDFDAFNFDKYQNQKHVGHGYIEGRLIMITENGTVLYTNDLTEELIPITYPFTDAEVVTKVEFGPTGITLLSGRNIWFIPYDNLEEGTLIFSADSPEEVFFHESSNVFFVSDQTGLYLSQDNMVDFEKRDNGIIGEIFDLQTANNILWANTGRWFRSDDQGNNWEQIEDGPLYENGEVLTAFNDWIFLRRDSVLYRADADGDVWDSIFVFNHKFKILETIEGVYFYDDESLIYTADGITFLERTALFGDGQYVFWEGQLLYFYENERFVSLDNGETWSAGEIVTGDHEGEIALVNGELVSVFIGDFSGYYWKSSDGGYTWHFVDTIYPIFISSTGGSAVPAKFHGHHNGIGFFNAGQGLLLTASNGHEWGMLPGPYITSHIRAFQGFYFENLLPMPLGVKFSDQTIFAYTSEQGIFSTAIAPIDSQLSQVIVTNTIDEVSAVVNYQIQPNPAHHNPSLTFQSEISTRLKVDLFGVDGKPIRQIIDRTPFGTGKHEIPINLDGLTKGVYFLHLETSKESKWLKLSFY